MKNKSTQTLLAILAIAGLIVTIVPSILNWQGIIPVNNVNTLMMVGTVLWFIPAILIFGKKEV